MAGLDTEQSERLAWGGCHLLRSVKVASSFPLTNLWALLAQGEGWWPAVTQTLATSGTPCGSAADPRTGMKASTPLLTQQNGPAFSSLPVPWFSSKSYLSEGAPFQMAPALASGSHMAPEHGSVGSASTVAPEAGSSCGMVPTAASCQGAGDGVLRGLAMTLDRVACVEEGG